MEMVTTSPNPDEESPGVGGMVDAGGGGTPDSASVSGVSMAHRGDASSLSTANSDDDDNDDGEDDKCGGGGSRDGEVQLRKLPITMVEVDDVDHLVAEDSIVISGGGCSTNNNASSSVDSGTESFSESPVLDESGETSALPPRQTRDNQCCPVGVFLLSDSNGMPDYVDNHAGAVAAKVYLPAATAEGGAGEQRRATFRHLIDRSISVEDECLMPLLRPTTPISPSPVSSASSPLPSPNPMQLLLLPLPPPPPLVSIMKKAPGVNLSSSGTQGQKQRRRMRRRCVACHEPVRSGAECACASWNAAAAAGARLRTITTTSTAIVSSRSTRRTAHHSACVSPRRRRRRRDGVGDGDCSEEEGEVDDDDGDDDGDDDEDDDEDDDSDCLITMVRRVTFPVDEAVLASYREPELQIPFQLNEVYYADDILRVYQSSCVKHQAIEVDAIKTQIKDMKHNTNRSATLNLATVTVTREVCETLEDLFRIANFHSIILKDSHFSAETVREFVNILEYYNCTTELLVTDLHGELLDCWKAFCEAVGRLDALESLCFQSMTINKSQMHDLLQHVRQNETINTLTFDTCQFDIVPVFNSDDFTKNLALRELYLPHSGIYAREADYLSRYLMLNRQLRVLDISNNPLGDRGLEALAKSLCAPVQGAGDSSVVPSGLSVLVIFNDQLTERSGQTLNHIISSCTLLHTLNMGFNNLTDQVLSEITPALEGTYTLEGLGLQSTLLTCRGAACLADVIQANKSLQKVNLKCNKGIQVEGLEKLCKAVTNTKIVRMEIDESNRNCHDSVRYGELVQNLSALCAVNQSYAETDAELTNLLWRKVSLNCEPIYTEPLTVMPCPSTGMGSHGGCITPPPLSPSPTPARNRFSVSRVKDKHHDITKHSVSVSSKGRFRVFSVTSVPELDRRDSPISFASSTPTPTESAASDDTDCDTAELVGHAFANMRGSVSSIDSVDSVLPPDPALRNRNHHHMSYDRPSSAAPSYNSD